MSGRLIGLTGYAGSGKSTVSAALKECGWVNVKMAGVLKDMCRIFFDAAGLDADECIDGVLKEKPLNEIGGVSPRHVMQTIGTEWGRGYISDDIWVRLASAQCERLMASGIDVVVDDIRFDNEAEMITCLGGTMVCVNGRGGIGGSHKSEAITKHSIELKNDRDVEYIKRLAVRILHDTESAALPRLTD